MVVDPIERAKKTELIRAVRELTKPKTWGSGFQSGISLEPIFEKYGCTCHPDREKYLGLEREMNEKVSEIQAQFDGHIDPLQQERAELTSPLDHRIAELQTQRKEAISEINGKYQPEILVLKQRVQATDAKEHPKLDSAAREAKYFMSTWMLERIDEGDNVLALPLDEMSLRYVEDWMGGWRPSPGEKLGS